MSVPIKPWWLLRSFPLCGSVTTAAEERIEVLAERHRVSTAHAIDLAFRYLSLDELEAAITEGIAEDARLIEGWRRAGGR